MEKEVSSLITDEDLELSDWDFSDHLNTNENMRRALESVLTGENHYDIRYRRYTWYV